MNKYKKRKRNLYNPESEESFRISRSKIDMFLECPRCFYLDRRLGLGRTSMPSFSLNNAVDTLFKKEFDILRKSRQSNELMKQYGIDAVPFNHPELSEWRDDYYKYVGASFLHQKTNLEICGIVDDIWTNKEGELFIVDYKSTSTKKDISLDDEYKQGYKKQAEIYQWIFRQKGFKVNDIAYFVFANAGTNKPEFDGKLEFELSIIPYKGDDSWVEPVILKIKECLNSDKIPEPGDNCEYCEYRKLINKELDNH